MPMPEQANESAMVAVVTRDDAAFSELSDVLAEVGLQAQRVEPAGDDGWRVPSGSDAILLDAEVVGEPDRLGAAIGDSGVDRDRPLILIVRTAIPREECIEWLEAGAWDVARLPVEEAVFPLRLRNLIRARRSREGEAGEEEDGKRGRYGWGTLRRVADESLSLADRYSRPLACVGVALEWPGHSGGWARSVVERLADATLEIVRRSDVIGISDDGALLVLLPDTPQPGAAIFLDKLVAHLEQRLRSWEILGRLRTATAYSSDVDSADELLRTAAEAVG